VVCVLPFAASQLTRRLLTKSCFNQILWRCIGHSRPEGRLALTVSAGIQSFDMAGVTGGVVGRRRILEYVDADFDTAGARSLWELLRLLRQTQYLYVGSGEDFSGPNLASAMECISRTDAGKTLDTPGNYATRSRSRRSLWMQNTRERVYVAAQAIPMPNAEARRVRSTDGGIVGEKGPISRRKHGRAELVMDAAIRRCSTRLLGGTRRAMVIRSGASIDIAGTPCTSPTDGGTNWKALSKGIARRGRRAPRGWIGRCPDDPKRFYASSGSGPKSRGFVIARMTRRNMDARHEDRRTRRGFSSAFRHLCALSSGWLACCFCCFVCFPVCRCIALDTNPDDSF